MVTNFEDQLSQIVERKNRATQPDNALQGYRLYPLKDNSPACTSVSLSNCTCL